MKNIFEDLEVHPIDEKMWNKWQKEKRKKMEEYEKLKTIFFHLYDMNENGLLSIEEIETYLKEKLYPLISCMYDEDKSIETIKSIKYELDDYRCRKFIRNYVEKYPSSFSIDFLTSNSDEYKEKRKQVIETMRKVGFKPVGF